MLLSLRIPGVGGGSSLGMSHAVGSGRLIEDGARTQTQASSAPNSVPLMAQAYRLI